jgi:hypothetical protein
MSWRVWLVFGLAGTLIGCNACTEESVVPNPVVESPPVVGGAASVEDLIKAWYEALESGDITSLDSLTLNEEHRILIYDCSASEDPELKEREAAELRTQMESKIGSVAAELAEAGAHFEYESARALQHIPMEEGDEIDGCLLLKTVIRHKVRSIVQQVDSSGTETQDMSFVNAFEIDGSWFLAGIPGPFNRDQATPRTVNPKSAPQVGPVIKGRTPTRIRPPSVEAPSSQEPAP